jgi:hypothetical protein
MAVIILYAISIGIVLFFQMAPLPGIEECGCGGRGSADGNSDQSNRFTTAIFDPLVNVGLSAAEKVVVGSNTTLYF